MSQDQSALNVWRAVRATLRRELGDLVYMSEIARLRVFEDSGKRIHVICPSEFSRAWVEDHVGARLRALWAAQDGPHEIHVCTESALMAQIGASEAVPAETVTTASDEPSTRPDRPAPSTAQPVGRTATPTQAIRFTFDTFMVGNANIMATTAARAVASATTPPFNPVFFHGEYGVGKTHLMSAIAHAVELGESGRKALLLTAEEFLNGFQSALRAKDVLPFKEQVRNCDVLLIDDIHFITGKPATEVEFLQTILAMISAGKQVVLASYYAPGDLNVCDLRLRDVLSGGFHCPLTGPDLDLRRKIIDCKIALAGQHCDDLEVPETVRDFLAARVTSSARELEGVLNNIIVRTAFLNRPVTLDTVEEVLGELPLRAEKRVTVDEIQKATAAHFKISVDDILSKRRTKTVVRPRHIAMYLAKTMTTRSLPDIGRRFGGRDHSTVIHAVNKVAGALESDSALNADIESVRRQLRNS